MQHATWRAVCCKRAENRAKMPPETRSKAKVARRSTHHRFNSIQHSSGIPRWPRTGGTTYAHTLIRKVVARRSKMAPGVASLRCCNDVVVDDVVIRRIWWSSLCNYGNCLISGCSATMCLPFRPCEWVSLCGVSPTAARVESDLMRCDSPSRMPSRGGSSCVRIIEFYAFDSSTSLPSSSSFRFLRSMVYFNNKSFKFFDNFTTFATFLKFLA